MNEKIKLSELSLADVIALRNICIDPDQIIFSYDKIYAIGNEFDSRISQIDFNPEKKEE